MASRFLVQGDCIFTRKFSALSPFSAEPFREGRMLNGSFK